MKDQYFGDINDYRKYALLRTLLDGNRLSLLVAWMLTPDDGGSDGGRRSYLSRPDEFARFDPGLFAGLSRLLAPPARPRVSLIERTSLLPRAAYFGRLVPDAQPARAAWRGELLAAASGRDLVFLDPDNGIEVASRPIGRRGSSKHVLWQEIEGLWALGSSLVIYQHFPRRPRGPFVRRLGGGLRRRTGAPLVAAFPSSSVVFFLVGQRRHAAELRSAVRRVRTAP
jgi:hypothetical protein